MQRDLNDHWCQLKENYLGGLTLKESFARKNKGERRLSQQKIEGVARGRRRVSGSTKVTRRPRQVG